MERDGIVHHDAPPPRLHHLARLPPRARARRARRAPARLGRRGLGRRLLLRLLGLARVRLALRRHAAPDPRADDPAAAARLGLRRRHGGVRRLGCALDRSGRRRRHRASTRRSATARTRPSCSRCSCRAAAHGRGAARRGAAGRHGGRELLVADPPAPRLGRQLGSRRADRRIPALRADRLLERPRPLLRRWACCSRSCLVARSQQPHRPGARGCDAGAARADDPVHVQPWRLARPRSRPRGRDRPRRTPPAVRAPPPSCSRRGPRWCSCSCWSSDHLTDKTITLRQAADEGGALLAWIIVLSVVSAAAAVRSGWPARACTSPPAPADDRRGGARRRRGRGRHVLRCRRRHRGR